MNSMNNQALVSELENRFSLLNVDLVSESQVAIDISNNDVHTVLAYLKSLGWKQLSMLTNVDWIEEGKYQLVYIIFNWDNPIYIQVRTKIERENPVFRTVTSVYPGAKYYERDVHEFFGVKFEGNPDSEKQLFLENWDDLPPLRKDFDAKAYSDRKYAKREYTKDFSNKGGKK
ncbi:NADH-quinone oxidoreductase subunit C [Mycoplasmatota bacterium]|nr:NADH-quinone oxidoreductase subunit C [Mycoplasmatota bacterium]